MSEIKCPFCGQELDYLAEDIYGNMYCPNCRDKNGFTYKASESIWQELIRTRKALGVAVDAMTQCSSMRGVELIETINAALAKIKDTIEIKGGDNE